MSDNLYVVDPKTGKKFPLCPFKYEGGEKPYPGFTSAMSENKNGNALFLLSSEAKYSNFKEEFDEIIKGYFDMKFVNKNPYMYTINNFFVSDDGKLFIVFD